MSAFTDSEIEYLKTQRIGPSCNGRTGWSTRRSAGWFPL
jgi:hypothetical protein